MKNIEKAFKKYSISLGGKGRWKLLSSAANEPYDDLVATSFTSCWTKSSWFEDQFTFLENIESEKFCIGGFDREILFYHSEYKKTTQYLLFTRTQNKLRD